MDARRQTSPLPEWTTSIQLPGSLKFGMEHCSRYFSYLCLYKSEAINFVGTGFQGLVLQPRVAGQGRNWLMLGEGGSMLWWVRGRAWSS